MDVYLYVYVQKCNHKMTRDCLHNITCNTCHSGKYGLKILNNLNPSESKWKSLFTSGVFGQGGWFFIFTIVLHFPSHTEWNLFFYAP